MLETDARALECIADVLAVQLFLGVVSHAPQGDPLHVVDEQMQSLQQKALQNHFGTPMGLQQSTGESNDFSMAGVTGTAGV